MAEDDLVVVEDDLVAEEDDLVAEEDDLVAEEDDLVVEEVDLVAEEDDLVAEEDDLVVEEVDLVGIEMKGLLKKSWVKVPTFLHACEGDAVTKLSQEKIPYFNAPIYLLNMTQIGKVDEIFGAINESLFTIKMMEGIVATSYAPGENFLYISRVNHRVAVVVVEDSPGVEEVLQQDEEVSEEEDLLHKVVEDFLHEVVVVEASEAEEEDTSLDPIGVIPLYIGWGLDGGLIRWYNPTWFNELVPSTPYDPSLVRSTFEKGSPDLKAGKEVADYLGTRHHEFHFTIVLSGEGSDEIFGGYLYFHKAPNKKEFHEETCRKIKDLHKYDCLRANKATSAWGVEARVPIFLEYIRVLLEQLYQEVQV
ncbi:unnamed protein product [Eruca vesicaria subsp. sativa]|uniref:Asparagine synthetase domain-containing protein n=1 Tax=Eruca vesicaria subsp. sativa TaxID=29727 RepID=A0ABC8LBM2_ERUVS|nr:unnamed protein product [Eruca vesicaria subsp. sativa]